MHEPPNNTLLHWMTRIDERLEGIEGRLIDKSDHEKLDDRVRDVEKKTERLAIKQASIAGSMSVAAVWLKTLFFGE